MERLQRGALVAMVLMRCNYYVLIFPWLIAETRF
uniref:Uncharacterized protein n=1 Tax=Arundo donax TaxID=35708 RepID=A0A0A9FN96_ARUDO